MKIGVLVSGGGTNLQAIIDQIEAGMIPKAEIAVVISNNEGVYALERAKNHKIPGLCLSPKNFENREAFHRALIDKLKEYDVELVVLAGYLVSISKEMIKTFPRRIINIHPSLIPSFCGVGFYGLKVHEEALKKGVKVTGATVHFVDEGMDTGAIILQKAVEVPEGITAKELQKKVMEEAEWKILPEAIRLITEGKIV
ncbi:Phosphoribosylglycinamide formyltransferase [Lachnospiraceae bacterium TWA4]|nr:Phosphoribosylglycinamide formyltransferase [Lachnospiraceae bacterium TWA4]